MKRQSVTIAVPTPSFLMEYDIASGVQRDMLAQVQSGRGYEPGTWRTFQWCLRPGDIVVDVGAHVGTFSCLAAALVGEHGHVRAFEPDTQNRRALIRNRDRNGFKHLTVQPYAVSNITERTLFYRCADNDGGHALWNPALSPANTETQRKPSQRVIQTVSLNTLGPPVCRLLKIDTEGAEAKVLEGASVWIRNTRPAIVAEINAAGLHHMGSSEADLRAILRPFDYDEYGIQDQQPFYVPVAEHQTLQPVGEQNGQRVFYVFNMLFLPKEWPEAAELRRGQTGARIVI